MLKKSFITLIILMFTLVSISMAFASSTEGGPDGNKAKGKYTYRKVCKACFKAGDTDSKKPKVSPADHTMAGGKQFLKPKTLKNLVVRLTGQNFLTKISMIFIHISINMPQIHQHRLNANKIQKKGF